jgi:Ca-activated chloride channel family protein
LCLRSLSPGCRFNIVSFGSHCESFFTESQPYDDESMKKAAAFVSSLDADMGGTELLAALEYAVGQRPIESPPSMWQAVKSLGGTRRSASREGGLPRQILLLTDGEVTNTDEIIDLAKKHATTARFFTFGIGAGASHHLVRGIARASGGAAEFISPGERIEAKVMRQFKRVLSPALTDVKVDWGQRAATPASDHVPPVFDGERLVVYALADEPTAGTATLTGTLAGRAVKFEVPVDPGRAVDGDTIATLAARARIRTLEEQGEYLESRGSLQRRGRTAAKAPAEIAALGVKYQLCSRETSFVAIEHRETPVTGRAELRRVPVALTSGWGARRERDVTGSFMLLSGAPMAPASMPRAAWIGTSAPYGGDSSAARSGDDSFDGAFSESFEGALDGDAAPDSHGPRYRVMQTPQEEPIEPVHAPRDLDRLVALQSADGSWDLTEEFAEIIGRSLDELEAELHGAPGGRAVARRIAATSLALEWLEREATAERAEWEMLAEKARRWLAAHDAPPARP